MDGLATNVILGLMEESARMSGGVGPDYDYSKIGQIDNRGHGSDKGKLPNHITFSTHSDYSTKDNPGGTWGKDFMGETNYRDTFTPTQDMINQHGVKAYQKYFKNSEPGVRLILNGK